jgi:hypothetical protein
VQDSCPLASYQQSIFDDEFRGLGLGLHLMQLATQNFDVCWGHETESDSVALDPHNFDRDVAVDDQLLTHFAT